MALCPIMYGNAMIAHAIMQASMKWGYEGVGGRYEALLRDAQCKESGCQWWGYWTWAEEESEYNFKRMAAYGCTFGQSQCVQGGGSTNI